LPTGLRKQRHGKDALASRTKAHQQSMFHVSGFQRSRTGPEQFSVAQIPIDQLPLAQFLIGQFSVAQFPISQFLVGSLVVILK
jgi:hypothetical protein